MQSTPYSGYFYGMLGTVTGAGRRQPAPPNKCEVKGEETGGEKGIGAEYPNSDVDDAGAGAPNENNPPAFPGTEVYSANTSYYKSFFLQNYFTISKFLGSVSSALLTQTL